MTLSSPCSWFLNLTMCFTDSLAPCSGILGTILGLDSSPIVAENKESIEQTLGKHLGTHCIILALLEDGWPMRFWDY